MNMPRTFSFYKGSTLVAKMVTCVDNVPWCCGVKVLTIEKFGAYLPDLNTFDMFSDSYQEPFELEPPDEKAIFEIQKEISDVFTSFLVEGKVMPGWEILIINDDFHQDKSKFSEDDGILDIPERCEILGGSEVNLLVAFDVTEPDEDTDGKDYYAATRGEYSPVFTVGQLAHYGGWKETNISWVNCNTDNVVEAWTLQMI